MPSLDLDKLIVRLAEEFKARDMRKHLDALRVYYRDFRRRKHAAMAQREPPWTEELVISWLSYLRVVPFENVLPVLARGVKACACDDKGPAMVACTFPRGCVRECEGCGMRWLERQG